MWNSQGDEEGVVNKEIHPEAQKFFEKTVNEFAGGLILQAKILAHQRGYESVSRKHIEEALDIARSERSRRWWQDIFILVGGTLFGTFIQGFITELQAQTPRPFWMAVYVTMGFIGMLLVFRGYVKR